MVSETTAAVMGDSEYSNNILETLFTALTGSGVMMLAKEGNIVGVTLLTTVLATHGRNNPMVVNAHDGIHELDVEHSLDGGTTWTRRGHVQYTVSLAEKKISVKFNEPGYELSKDDRKQIASSGKELLYLVRMLAVNGNGETKPGQHLVAAVRACALLDGGIEMLQLHCDKTGATVALQFQTPVSGRTCPATTNTEGSGGSKRITNKIVTVLHKEAASIPATSYGPVRQMGGNGPDGNEPGEPKAPESFLQKYWYVFLPMAIWTLVLQPMLAPAGGGGGEAAPGERRGGGGGGGSAGAAGSGR